MKIKPLHDWVLIARLDEAEKTKGGIIIPDQAKEKPQQGEIISVGPGRKYDSGDRVPLQVKKGDRVFFSRYAGKEIQFDHGEYFFMREDDILAIISE